MPRKKRPPRYTTSQALRDEKQLKYVTADLRDARILEESEIPPDFSQKGHASYRDYTGKCGLTPTPEGWGLLHCTVHDKKHGRRRRISLATDDLTYHRAFAAAARTEIRTAPIDLALARYPYRRWGWPGPPGQSGSWPGGDSIVWRPTCLDAAPRPDDPDDRHLHGLQCSDVSEPRHVSVEFKVGRRRGKWLMLPDGPVPGSSMVMCPDVRVQLLIPPGAAVLPGWPVPPPAGPCPRCD